MRKKLAFIFAALGWFAVIAQYYLTLENRVVDIIETNIRFFSFFTILTNILVALYFSFEVLWPPPAKPLSSRSGALTALTVYITVVGLGYQILLRHIWDPTGLQMVVDELLHSIIPVLVMLYWYLYAPKSTLRYQQLFVWLLYPLAYLIYVLLRGSFSDFYPYPFINVQALGLTAVLMNSLGFAMAFILLSALFISLGKKIQR
ncbi:Pr6Pr family membrane protein [Parapedobacter sp. DT-150]|uniref:Pr6Pr family membrane protein n=1 Tax=Parapedobacter sp. DT-150 TaxID=3396162 RepID=UPI003F1A2308